ncbi:MAG: penicillin-binding protein 1C [bacterium]|nr:penicillin-binding protein 1C [bacterium]
MRWVIAAGVIASGIGAGLAALYLTRPAVPAFATVHAEHRPSDVRLLDRDGVVLHERRTDPSRRRLDWVPLGDVSPALRAAVLTAEDRHFRTHRGVDWPALVRGLLRRRGASTVTMQVAALVDPALRVHRGPRGPRAKWRQIRVARALERAWSKDEILETYLNLVTFRGELVGVGAAAGVLFGKAPHGLDAAESVTLAALLRAPAAARERLTQRGAALGAAMAPPVAAGAVARAVATALTAPVGGRPAPAWAPHVARRLLPSGAVRADVHSTLSAPLQRAAVTALRRNLLAVRARGVEDGAVLVVDNRSGDVLAYVGSSGALSRAPHVDGVVARRQAGSALKPFLYGLALEQRLLTPATLLEDAPLEIATAQGLYRPRNYDERHRGLVSVRTALGASLNTPAVRVLELLGGEPFLARLRALGFAGLTRPATHYGPSLALGSADVSLWELVGAYRGLATGGLASPLRLTGDEAPAPTRVLAADATFLVAQVLADREGRSPTFGLESVLATPGWSAVKTGTSKDMRDNWCVGFSARVTVGVWVGNFSGAPMHDVSGVTGAAPIWAELMAAIQRDAPSRPPEPPAGVVSVAVTFPRDLEPARPEWFLAGTETRMAGARALAGAPPRIRTPTAGTRIALDPDVPAGHQRLLLEADTGDRPLRWRLDGQDLGPAHAPRLWEPRPGRHVLALVDAASRTLDEVAFEVRGR